MSLLPLGEVGGARPKNFLYSDDGSASGLVGKIQMLKKVIFIVSSCVLSLKHTLIHEHAWCVRGRKGFNQAFEPHPGTRRDCLLKLPEMVEGPISWK